MEWYTYFLHNTKNSTRAQFPCPKCGEASLIFYGEENWVWVHCNQNDDDPKADFCLIGKIFPSRFRDVSFPIEPQRYEFYAALREIGPHDGIRFYT